MAWDVEGTDEFAGWFEALSDEEQVSVGRVVELLVEHRSVAAVPVLVGHRDVPPPPYARTQNSARGAAVPLYAFDPRRAAILLLGGDKTGNDRWYEEQVPVADRLYDEYLRQLEREGLI